MNRSTSMYDVYLVLSRGGERLITVEPVSEETAKGIKALYASQGKKTKIRKV